MVRDSPVHTMMLFFVSPLRTFTYPYSPFIPLLIILAEDVFVPIIDYYGLKETFPKDQIMARASGDVKHLYFITNSVKRNLIDVGMPTQDCELLNVRVTILRVQLNIDLCKRVFTTLVPT